MDISSFENRIGYTFQDRDLIGRALTHRSWAHESLAGRNENEIRAAENESLEFVGDSVLGLVISEELFRKFPNASEGQLTLMKHRLVSMTTLASIAESLRLGDLVRIGRGEEKTGGRQKKAILADTLEAVIAAVFFDSGYTAVRSFISRAFADELDRVSPSDSVDYKTTLQEMLQAARLSAPTYSLIRTEGQPHERTFYVEASWETGSAEGQGSSIKAAEMMAANAALKALQEERSVEAETQKSAST